MDREIELLLHAFDLWLQSGPDDAQRNQVVFESLLDDLLASRSNLTKEQLLKALRAYYPRWIRGQEHPPTLPPKA